MRKLDQNFNKGVYIDPRNLQKDTFREAQKHGGGIMRSTGYIYIYIYMVYVVYMVYVMPKTISMMFEWVLPQAKGKTDGDIPRDNPL